MLILEKQAQVSKKKETVIPPPRGLVVLIA